MIGYCGLSRMGQGASDLADFFIGEIGVFC